MPFERKGRYLLSECLWTSSRGESKNESSALRSVTKLGARATCSLWRARGFGKQGRLFQDDDTDLRSDMQHQVFWRVGLSSSC